LSPAATEDAIRLLDGRQAGLEGAEFLEIFWTRDRRPMQIFERKGLSGAGYGDRTRVRGLGSLCTTIVLSPLGGNGCAHARRRTRLHLTSATPESGPGLRRAAAPSPPPSSPPGSAAAAVRYSTAAH